MEESRERLAGNCYCSGRARSRDERSSIRTSSVQIRLTAWAYYSLLIGKWKDSRKALKVALKRAFALEQDEEIDEKRAFDCWEKHDLWPPPELEDTPYGKTFQFQDNMEQERPEDSRERKPKVT